MNFQSPAARLMVEELLPVAGSSRRARDVVTDVCLRWDFAHLVAPATLIISELVSNAADHAHTLMTIEAAVQGSCLYLAVHDGSSAPPVLRAGNDEAKDARGHGLQLVAAFSSAWGYVADTDGKTVWATLALTTGLDGGRSLR